MKTSTLFCIFRRFVALHPIRWAAMHNSKSISAAVVFIFALMLSVPMANATAPTLTPAEQDVIDALLQQDTEMKASMHHVIQEATSVSSLYGIGNLKTLSSTLRVQAKDHDKAFREAVDDFIKKNKTPVQIIFPTNAPKNVELVTNAQKLLPLPEMSDVFPSGYLIKSRAGLHGWHCGLRAPLIRERAGRPFPSLRRPAGRHRWLRARRVRAGS